MAYRGLYTREELVAHTGGITRVPVEGTEGQLKMPRPGPASIRLVQQGARKWPDVVSTEWADLFLFSERVVASIRKHGFSGIEFNQVEVAAIDVRSLKPGEMPNYSWANVVGLVKYSPLVNEAPLEVTPNGLAFTTPPPRGTRVVAIFYPDAEQTYDFGYPVPPWRPRIYISQRVVDAAKQEKWSGIVTGEVPRDRLRAEL